MTKTEQVRRSIDKTLGAIEAMKGILNHFYEQGEPFSSPILIETARMIDGKWLELVRLDQQWEDMILNEGGTGVKADE